MVAAADTFLAALTAEQKAAVQIARNQTNAIQWSNFPAGVVKRNGVKLGDMSAAAQAAAIALAEVAAGPTGATMLSEVRAADEAYKAVSGNTTLFGNGEYYFSIHGTASTSSSWMLQIAGHHLAYNFTYGGKCTSATPLFDGVQPAKWTDESNVAHDPLAGQRDAVAALFASVGAVNGAVLSGTFSDMINGPAGMGDGGRKRFESIHPHSLTRRRGAARTSRLSRRRRKRW